MSPESTHRSLTLCLSPSPTDKTGSTKATHSNSTISTLQGDWPTFNHARAHMRPLHNLERYYLSISSPTHWICNCYNMTKIWCWDLISTYSRDLYGNNLKCLIEPDDGHEWLKHIVLIFYFSSRIYILLNIHSCVWLYTLYLTLCNLNVIHICALLTVHTIKPENKPMLKLYFYTQLVILLYFIFLGLYYAIKIMAVKLHKNHNVSGPHVTHGPCVRQDWSKKLSSN